LIVKREHIDLGYWIEKSGDYFTLSLICTDHVFKFELVEIKDFLQSNKEEINNKKQFYRLIFPDYSIEAVLFEIENYEHFCLYQGDQIVGFGSIKVSSIKGDIIELED